MQLSTIILTIYFWLTRIFSTVIYLLSPPNTLKVYLVNMSQPSLYNRHFMQKLATDKYYDWRFCHVILWHLALLLRTSNFWIGSGRTSVRTKTSCKLYVFKCSIKKLCCHLYFKILSELIYSLSMYEVSRLCNICNYQLISLYLKEIASCFDITKS